VSQIEFTARGDGGPPVRTDLPPRWVEFTACGPTAKISRKAGLDVMLVYAGGIAVRIFVKVWARMQARPDIDPSPGPLLLAGAVVAAGLVALLFRRMSRRGDHWAVFLGGVVAFVSFFRFDSTPLAAGTPLEKPLVLVPLVPAGLAIWSFLRMVRNTDELQRRILYQALSVGFVVTLVATLAYSVLENLGVPRISAAWWWSVLVLSWVAGLAIFSRRYE